LRRKAVWGLARTDSATCPGMVCDPCIFFDSNGSACPGRRRVGWWLGIGGHVSFGHDFQAGRASRSKPSSSLAVICREQRVTSRRRVFLAQRFYFFFPRAYDSAVPLPPETNFVPTVGSSTPPSSTYLGARHQAATARGPLQSSISGSPRSTPPSFFDPSSGDLRSCNAEQASWTCASGSRESPGLELGIDGVEHVASCPPSLGFGRDRAGRRRWTTLGGMANRVAKAKPACLGAGTSPIRVGQRG